MDKYKAKQLLFYKAAIEGKNKETSVPLFFKFGKYKWMKKLANGELSFSCTGNFINEAIKTGNEIQGDAFEGVFARLKNNDYRYYITTLTTISTGDVKGLAKDSKAYKAINYGKSYWIATTTIGTGIDTAGFDMLTLTSYTQSNNAQITGQALFWSSGGCATSAYGVRAVVTLSSDIALTGSSESGWNF